MGLAAAKGAASALAGVSGGEDGRDHSFSGCHPGQHRRRSQKELDMNVGLDTSVLFRLLIGSPPGQARSAVHFLDNLCRSGGKACVSDLVIAESYFALQFHYGINKTDALAGLAALLSTGEIIATGQAGRI